MRYRELVNSDVISSFLFTREAFVLGNSLEASPTRKAFVLFQPSTTDCMTSKYRYVESKLHVFI